MSQTYIAILVNILATLLPKIGVTVGSEALTTTLQTLIVVISGVWVLIRRYKRGDVTVAGFIK